MARKTNKEKSEERQITSLLKETLNELKAFRGNPKLKRQGEILNFSDAQQDEIKKCINDPVYFAENYIKIVHVDKGLIPIELYPYQKNIIETMKNERFVVVNSCRQAGKCVNNNTTIKVKHKDYNNGEPFETTVGDFYNLQYK